MPTPYQKNHETPGDVPRPPRLYGVGAVAKVTGASPRMVSAWIDKGTLKGHRLPGSKHRRVYEFDLVRFLLKFELWVPPEMLERYRRESPPTV